MGYHGAPAAAKFPLCTVSGTDAQLAAGLAGQQAGMLAFSFASLSFTAPMSSFGSMPGRPDMAM